MPQLPTSQPLQPIFNIVVNVPEQKAEPPIVNVEVLPTPPRTTTKKAVRNSYDGSYTIVSSESDT